MSWKKEPDRADLSSVSVLLTSEESKVPEDARREDKIHVTARLISLCQPQSLVQGGVLAVSHQGKREVPLPEVV